MHYMYILIVDILYVVLMFCQKTVYWNSTFLTTTKRTVNIKIPSSTKSDSSIQKIMNDLSVWIVTFLTFMALFPRYFSKY